MFIHIKIHTSLYLSIFRVKKTGKFFLNYFYLSDSFDKWDVYLSLAFED